MNKILVSCFSLCKIENNGKFKSTKQADFILSQFDENKQYHAMTIASYNNLVNWEVTADQAGIVSIIKTAEKSGKKAVYFQRRNDADQADLIAQKELEKEQRKQADKAYAIERIAYLQGKIDAEKQANNNVIELAKQQPNATQEKIQEIQELFNQAISLRFKAELAEIEKLKAEIE
jgi:hypothetical protein